MDDSAKIEDMKKSIYECMQGDNEYAPERCFVDVKMPLKCRFMGKMCMEQRIIDNREIEVFYFECTRGK